MSGRVIVVGGGVSGLTAAHRLRGKGSAPELMVLEGTAHAGGKLASAEVGGLRVPAGADSFLARKPWAVELCRELGIGSDLVPPAESGAWLWTPSGLVPFPTGTAFGIPGDIGDVIRWRGVSRKGRRRALLDLVKAKRKGEADETLGSLLRRRLGDEATDLAVGPLLAGLHAGDVDRLSVQATFPDLQAWERTQGSLIRGAQAASKAAGRGSDPGPMFLRPRQGVEALTDVVAEELGPALRAGVAVTGLQEAGHGWAVRTVGGERLAADALVLAVPASAAAELLTEVAPEAARGLAAIRSVSTASVLMVYCDDTASALPHGSGFVVPRGRAPMTACTWLSSKWPDPSFGTRAVLRCFVGADGEEDVLEAPDEDLVEACARHLAALLPLPDRPEHARVIRWPAAMPQYELGHLERVAAIRDALPPGIVVTGQSYDGVGVADCVRAAGSAADLIAAHLVAAHRGGADRADRETVA
ncbi:MAG: protoporphyrinogen oxidase [Actinomycetota bacterium]